VQPNDEPSGFALPKRDREKTKGTDPNNFWRGVWKKRIERIPVGTRPTVCVWKEWAEKVGVWKEWAVGVWKEWVEKRLK
jgi:hypothetical protein